MNKNQIHYCWINSEYLRSIFDEETLKQRKYLSRPFVFIPDLNMAIAIPQITNKKQLRYRHNYYFKDKEYYLDVANYIFVPFEMTNFNKNWVEINMDDKYLNEIKENIHIIWKIIKNVNILLEKSQKFKDEHKFIIISKEAYTKFKKHFS